MQHDVIEQLDKPHVVIARVDADDASNVDAAAGKDGAAVASSSSSVQQDGKPCSAGLWSSVLTMIRRTKSSFKICVGYLQVTTAFVHILQVHQKPTLAHITLQSSCGIPDPQ